MTRDADPTRVLKSLGIPDAVEDLHVELIRAATSDLPNSRKRTRSPREDQALDSGEDKASDSGDDQASGDYPVEAGRSVVVCEGLPPYVRRVTYTHWCGVVGE